MTYQFKPWEIPTGGRVRPGSVTVAIPQEDLLVAKLTGIAAYQSPFEQGVDLDDPKRRWYLHERVLPNGYTLYLEPMLGANLSLTLTPDHVGVERWCYHDHDAAWRAVLGWNGVGDPEGWYRHPRTGRRRPDSTPETEYINAGDR